MDADVIIAGGGIVGLATALALQYRHALKVIVLEAEDSVAKHQSGRNSGVLHAGVYYAPGSLKARLCVRGRALMEQFCDEHGIARHRSGKVIVANNEEQAGRLGAIAQRALKNGLTGIEQLDSAGIRRQEPECVGVAGLWVPHTGVTNFGVVTRKMAEKVSDRGGMVMCGQRITSVHTGRDGVEVESATDRLRARYLVGCCGVQADRFARLCNVYPEILIVPFRGEYHVLSERANALVRGLIYPVPRPGLPFLGVHLTRMIDERVEAGPTAVLSLNRTGYARGAIRGRDVLDTLGSLPFWRMARGLWRPGLAEIWRSKVRSAFVRSVRRLVPAIESADLTDGRTGIRAQAVDRRGRLVDDFSFAAGERMLHVMNAPSPAATASLAIGEHVAAKVAFELRSRS